MRIRVFGLLSLHCLGLILLWPFSYLTISGFRLKPKRQKGPVAGGRASVCLLQRDQTVVEGPRDPGSPFSLTPGAVSGSILSVPYMGRESLATVVLALVLYHTAL